MTTNTFDKLAQHEFSVGVELPLDNDWAHFDATKGMPFGIPDMTEHHSRIQLADKLGFKAAWVRDVPVYVPSLGENGSFADYSEVYASQVMVVVKSFWPIPFELFQ
nr:MULTISPECIES: hypothetical protein [Alteromonas]|tara:strand:+ start:42542 stop:42859 length:318 start_codon:yes stop_codon:yes gene_type:complete